MRPAVAASALTASALAALAGCAIAASPPNEPAATEPAATQPAASERIMVGVQSCRGCHHVQAVSWEMDPHGKAFETLRPGVKAAEKQAAALDAQRDYTTDPSCLGCHSTGYGQRGGFVSEATTPHMTGVGCESCHGAGSEYVGKLMMRRFSFAHAEAIDYGHISYVNQAAVLAAEGRSRPKTEKQLAAYAKTALRAEEFNSPEVVPLEQYDRYGYSPLGDPPPWARRYEGELLPLDRAAAHYCTDGCHNEQSPTWETNGLRNFEADFDKHVKRGVHRRFGLKFLHW